jgi:hypothetical protein
MRGKHGDEEAAALERAELYFMAHPGSPSAIRRPSLSFRAGTWIALLGHDVRDGIAGFGSTVEAALRAFDTQYLNALRGPNAQLVASLSVRGPPTFHRAA